MEKRKAALITWASLQLAVSFCYTCSVSLHAEFLFLRLGKKGKNTLLESNQKPDKRDITKDQLVRASCLGHFGKKII